MSGNLQGKVCIVTGASRGIGKLTTERLARLQATVVLICRNEQLGKQTVDEIARSTSNSSLDLRIADLSSQASVRKVAAELTESYPQIHLLVNNAGTVLGKRTMSADGIEITLATNHLSHFLLTNLLMNQIKAAAPSTIINVSSEAHRNVRSLFDNLQGEKKYSGFGAYSVSKLCNVLFTYELARRLQGTGVRVIAMHPGYLNTAIFRPAPSWMRFLVKLTAGDPARGADAILQLALDPGAQSGKYFDKTTEKASSELSQDRSAAEKLWEISSSLTGMKVQSNP